MKKIILAAALAVACTGLRAQEKEYKYEYQFKERDYIEVNARAWREVTPDEIFLQIILDQNDTKGKYTIDQLESQLYAALKKAGVDADKELRVSDMSSELKSYLLKKNEGRITKEFVLKVTNTQIMPVFRELDKVGITGVSISSSRYSKISELYDELLGEAVETARRRAQVMTEAANKGLSTMSGSKARLGQMIYVQTYDNSSAYDAGMATNGVLMKSARVAMPEAAPTFEFNKQRVEVNVTTRFLIY